MRNKLRAVERLRGMKCFPHDIATSIMPTADLYIRPYTGT